MDTNTSCAASLPRTVIGRCRRRWRGTTRYYAEEGTPTGRWLGSGLTGLGEGRLAVEDQVSEAQLQLLIGMGRDPITGEPLGRAFPQYAPVAERIGARAERLPGELGPAGRAEAVAQIEAEEAARGTRRRRCEWRRPRVP